MRPFEAVEDMGSRSLYWKVDRSLRRFRGKPVAHAAHAWNNTYDKVLGFAIAPQCLSKQFHESSHIRNRNTGKNATDDLRDAQQCRDGQDQQAEMCKFEITRINHCGLGC